MLGGVYGLVSIIVPVYNRPRMLRRAVESALAQTYRPVEVVIVDDGSTDETPAAAADLTAAHPSLIRVIRQENRGAGRARETGLAAVRGEFIQFLDSDDRLLPDKFALQVAALRERSDCGVCYGVTRLVDEGGRVLKEPLKASGEDRTTLFPGLLVDRWWSTHTPLFRRSVVEAARPYPDLPVHEDWLFEAAVGAAGTRLCRVPEAVSETVVHAGERLTTAADWTTRDRLAIRTQLITGLWQGATAAGVRPGGPEAEHLARWAFATARRTAARGMREETAKLLRIVRVAGPDVPGRQVFEVVARVTGPRVAGELFWRAESLYGHRRSVKAVVPPRAGRDETYPCDGDGVQRHHPPVQHPRPPVGQPRHG
ncbi:glycosyltransferase family A protein [Alienimonas chondri]|uniref:glycosyltransferase family A protein n=1 Tax=Alienimonas chondri TaxID=2681879 RepID=UPI0039C87520